MSTPARVDWPQIKELWPAEERCVAIIERRAIHVILSLFERFEWLATYDKSQEAAEDWDYIQRIMADAEYELGVAMPLSELIPYIDEIEPLLQALNEHANCCGSADVSDGDWYTEPVVDGMGNVPQDIIDAGYASGPSDWAGFDDYKCMIAHVMVDHLEGSVRMLHKNMSTTGIIVGGIVTVASIVAAVLTSGMSLLLEGILASTGAVAGLYTLLAAVGKEDLAQLADGIAADHNDLACAIYEADGSEGAVEALKDKLDELYSDVNAALLKNLNLGPSMKALYAGRYDQMSVAQELVDKGYDLEDFSCFPCTPGYDPGNYLMDGGFELTALPGPIWKHGPNAEGIRTAVAAYNGNYGWKGSAGAGGPDTYYTYQEFTVDRAGTMRGQYWSKHYQGSYNSFLRVEKYVDSSWVRVGSTNWGVPPWDGQWHEILDQSAGYQTAGLYRIRLGLGYNYFDDIRITIDWEGPG